MIPPPNVTGSLHMGHGFNNAIMDALIRYHRMRGEHPLAAGHRPCRHRHPDGRRAPARGRGKTRHDLGREAFIERVWQWKAESGGTITRQLRRLGSSLGLAARALHDGRGPVRRGARGLRAAVRGEGLIYRGKRLVNWDPVLHTAISDLEVISEEEAGHMWDIKLPAEQRHRRDDRLHHAPGDHARRLRRGGEPRGRALQAPDRRDRRAAADRPAHPDHRRRARRPELGTGCVKITPAHDFNDHAVWLRHRDENADRRPAPWRADQHLHRPMPRSATTPRRRRADPGAYIGLDRFEARKRIVADLEAQGLLARSATTACRCRAATAPAPSSSPT
jgi:valyl-tRNA synthetase